MKNYENIKAFNEYIGLENPKREGVDIGKYHGCNIKLSSPPITTDFYRISIKYDFEDVDLIKDANPEFTPKAFMFFSSPNQIIQWGVPKMWRGFFIQLSRQTILENKYLFFNFMEYGLHEGLYLKEREAKQLNDLFNQLYKSYGQKDFSNEIVLSYCHLIFTFVEHFYKRQFATKREKINRLTKQFISLLNEYYSKGHQTKFGMPTVQFFADSLNVSAGYLGDTVKNITGISPIEHIHLIIVEEAKEHLKKGMYSNSEVAYHLGFEYPNYFSRLFRKVTGLSPTEFRKQ